MEVSVGVVKIWKTLSTDKKILNFDGENWW